MKCYAVLYSRRDASSWCVTDERCRVSDWVEIVVFETMFVAFVLIIGFSSLSVI